MRLFVFLDGNIAGTLETQGSRVRFAYSELWLQERGSYPVSQAWPLQPTAITGAAVTNFLWELLPDNERTLDAWARRFQVSARNPVALLSHVGEDCAGAVQFFRGGFNTSRKIPARRAKMQRKDNFPSPALRQRPRCISTRAGGAGECRKDEPPPLTY